MSHSTPSVSTSKPARRQRRVRGRFACPVSSGMPTYIRVSCYGEPVSLADLASMGYDFSAEALISANEADPETPW